MTKTIYAFGDIHGQLDILDGLLAKVFQHIESNKIEDFQMVFLGDYVDRGPDSKGVIDRIMSLQETFDVVAIKGNHEDLMLNAAAGPAPEGGWTVSQWREREECMYWWTINGGIQTMESYGGECAKVDPYTAYREIDKAHLDWLKSLPTWYETETHYFVHAGVNPRKSLSDQNDNSRMWIREEWLRSTVDMGKHVVHGHTISKEVELLPHRTNLDTGGFYFGMLSCGVFQGEGGPSEILQAYGKPAN